MLQHRSRTFHFQKFTSGKLKKDLPLRHYVITFRCSYAGPVRGAVLQGLGRPQGCHCRKGQRAQSVQNKDECTPKCLQHWQPETCY